MGLDPFGRRDLFVGAGGAFLCTLAGQRVATDKSVDLTELSAEIPVPPKVKAAEGSSTLVSSKQAPGGQRREYWIRAERVRWNIVPNGRDAMMDKKIKGKTKFVAYAYRAYSPGFAAPLGPATIPGPLIEAEVGDAVVVNFQNAVDAPVTIHPHGIFYSEDMDGAYKGRHTDPGGFVQPKQTFQYVWEAREGTEGAWLYHDHGPLDPLPVFKGLFGPLIIRPAGVPAPTREFNLTFHSFPPVATGLRMNFSCVNGAAFAGNTPTLRANVGDSRRLQRLRARQRLPHVPHPRTSLDRSRRQGHRQPDAWTGRLDHRGICRGQPRPLVLPLPRVLPSARGDERLVPRFLAVALALAALVPAAAEGANRRIAISNYQWSSPEIALDLGEHATWYWVGPDVVHSVTGDSANAAGLDSDPNDTLPQHPVGDSFEISFNEPGVYDFVCKLHSTVRGTVTVSNTPGDPVSEPDPVPPNLVDLKAPKLRKLALSSPLTGRGGPLRFTLGEPAKLDADYFRRGRNGERTFAGYAKWRGYLGLNQIRFGARGRHFDAKPGRYVAELRATDRDNNLSKPRTVRFEIRRRR